MNPNTWRADKKTEDSWFIRVKPIFSRLVRVLGQTDLTHIVVEDYVARPPFRHADVVGARTAGLLIGIAASWSWRTGVPLILLSSTWWKPAAPVIDKHLARFDTVSDHALDATKMALLCARVIHKELSRDTRD